MPKDLHHIAVMLIDIGDFSLLKGSDEDRGFDMFKRNHTIHEILNKKYNGTLIKEVDDSALASFTPASDAVRCAIDIQAEVRSQKIPLKNRIHQGEMVLVEGDALRDGVNAASGLQELSSDGCFTLSGMAYKDMKTKAGINAKYVEYKRLKNVDDFVRYLGFCVKRENEKTAQMTI